MTPTKDRCFDCGSPITSFLNLRNSKRKFYRGDNCCGNCDDGKHQTCRPKLDGTLCSCSCSRALMVRDEHARKLAIAQSEGRESIATEEATEIIAPRYRRKW